MALRRKRTKEAHVITKRPVGEHRVRVTFTMPAGIWADSIHLVGDFNNWNTSATPLRLDDSGWHASVDLEADRAYHYRYLIDGSEWHNDWQADCYEPNEYGGDNSVVLTSGFVLGTRRRIVSSAD
jgi:1,4-alpha-glucan branching enzyme